MPSSLSFQENKIEKKKKKKKSKIRKIKENKIKIVSLQMSMTQTINMSDFGDTLITHGFEVRTMLSKFWFCLVMLSTSLDVRYSLELL